MDTRHLMYHYTGNPINEKKVLSECIETVIYRGDVPATKY